MIFNLGLTANAAAAHESDLVDSQIDHQRPSPIPSPGPSSPTISFTNLPLGFGSLYSRYKGTDTSGSQNNNQLRGMPTGPESVVSSSDADYSVVGPDLARSRVGRSQSVRNRKLSSRPKTSYQLAHPASHARHRRLKLRPKLLLQLQQVSQTPRPLPVLDVLPSTVHLPRLARKFPTIIRGKNGLGPNDLIVVTSDLYDRTSSEADNAESGDDDEHREVVATICQLLCEDALSKGKAEICLNYGPVWEATPLPNGSYEFMAHTEHGVQLMRWVQRGSKNRRTSAPPGSINYEENKRFTFSVIDPNTRRHPVIATMTRNHLEVMEQYAMPAPSSAPTTSPVSAAASVISDGSDVDALERDVIVMDDKLRTLIIITSIWVAFREGWSDNFRYDDSGLGLNSKAICSPIASRHTSPTAIKSEDDQFGEERDSYPDKPLRNGTRHRLSTSTVRPSGISSPTDLVKSIASGSLTKRSNSTGAAFIERSKRRSASGTGGRLNRHSMLNNPNEISRDGASSPAISRQDPEKRETSDAKNGKPQRSSGHVQQPDASHEKGTRDAEPSCTKEKRRRRLSSLFSIFSSRKNGAH